MKTKKFDISEALHRAYVKAFVEWDGAIDGQSNAAKSSHKSRVTNATAAPEPTAQINTELNSKQN